MNYQIRKKIIFKNNYYLIIPAFIFTLTIFIIPNILNFYYAFTNWSAYHSQVNFVGLRNFIELTKEGYLWRGLFTTIKYAVFITIVENSMALVLALVLEKTSRINGFLRSVFFLPVLISPLAAGYLFRGILDPKGSLNHLLSNIFFTKINFPWLGTLSLTIFVAGLVHAWKWGGIHMLIYIAALNTIPPELIESARIDGSNYWQIFKNIKLPLIGPALTFNISLIFVGALSVFDLIFSLTSGGPGTATQVLNFFIYKQFSTGRFSYATSISVVLFLVILITGISLVVFLRKREVEFE